MPRRAAPGSFARRLGARIKALRETAGLTQETLAWECGFAKSNLSQLEAGKHAPSIAALRTIARRLGVDIVDILACDTSNPLHALVDAIRVGDRVRAERALTRLGLAGEADVDRKPKAAERPRRGQ